LCISLDISLDHTILIVVLKTIVPLLTFGYAAISDWVKREIHPLTWVFPIATGIIVNYNLYSSLSFSILNVDVIKRHVYVSLIVSVIIVVLIAILSFVLGLIGGADVLALISFISVYPSNLEFLCKAVTWSFNNNFFIIMLIPPIVFILLVYLLIMVTIIIVNISLNLLKLYDIKKLKLPLSKVFIYVVFGRVMRIKEALSKKFYYPIYIPGFLERFTFDVEEDYQAWITKLKELDPEMVVITTWGIPMVTFMAVAIYTYIFVYTILMLL
jgi:hypothetical protein